MTQAKDPDYTITNGLTPEDYKYFITLSSDPNIAAAVAACQEFMTTFYVMDPAQARAQVRKILTDFKATPSYAKLSEEIVKQHDRPDTTATTSLNTLKAHTRYSDRGKSVGVPPNCPMRPNKIAEYFPSVNEIHLNSNMPIRSRQVRAMGCQAKLVRCSPVPPAIIFSNYPREATTITHGFELGLDHAYLVKHNRAVPKDDGFLVPFNGRQIFEKPTILTMPIRQQSHEVILAYSLPTYTGVFDLQPHQIAEDVSEKYSRKIRHITPKELKTMNVTHRTPKIDGQLLYLHFKEGQVIALQTSNGSIGSLNLHQIMFHGVVEPALDAVIECEMVNTKTKPILVLLRLLRYNGLCLPYTLADLARFKLKANIDVLLSTDPEVANLPSDGEILHGSLPDSFYVQRYLKETVTHDLDYDTASQLDTCVGRYSGIQEFKLNDEGRLVFLKRRELKNTSDSLVNVHSKELASKLNNLQTGKDKIKPERYAVVIDSKRQSKSPLLSFCNSSTTIKEFIEMADENTPLELLNYLTGHNIVKNYVFRVKEEGTRTTLNIIFGDRLIINGHAMHHNIDPLSYDYIYGQTTYTSPFEAEPSTLYYYSSLLAKHTHDNINGGEKVKIRKQDRGQVIMGAPVHDALARAINMGPMQDSELNVNYYVGTHEDEIEYNPCYMFNTTKEGLPYVNLCGSKRHWRPLINDICEDDEEFDDEPDVVYGYDSDE